MRVAGFIMDLHFFDCPPIQEAKQLNIFQKVIYLKDFPYLPYSPYIYTVLITWIIATAYYSLPTGYIGNKGLITRLWTHENLEDTKLILWKDQQIWLVLFTTFIIRFFAIMLMATGPFPSGISLPSITQGAILGRLYGEILRWYQPQTQVQNFSMIGAAAFAGVLTRTSSVSILIVELTGQTNLLLGVLIASLCATGIANIFTMSAFNTSLSISRMPYLPFMFKNELYKMKVGDFCHEMDEFLTEDMSLFGLLNFYYKKRVLILDEFIPIVDSSSDRKVVGSVRTQNVIDYMKSVLRDIEEELKKSKLKTAIKNISTKLSAYYKPRRKSVMVIS